jgi:hypothetical protein
MRSVPFLLSLLALSALPSLASTARADEPTPAAPSAAEAPVADGVPAREPALKWYGWQSLSTDGGSLALLIAGASVGKSGGEVMDILGATAFVFGSPLIHLGHEHPGKALGSFALRAVAPVGTMFTGALLGGLVTSGHSSEREDNLSGIGYGALIGGISGTVLTILIDDLVIAREKAQEPPPPPPEEAHVTIEPRIGTVRGGATLGIGGTF